MVVNGSGGNLVRVQSPSLLHTAKHEELQARAVTHFISCSGSDILFQEWEARS